MFDLAETDRLLTTTRAVRRRLDLDRPVEREVILDCLRIATQAPTASNGQTWRWMVVTDADKRRALADLYREAGMGYLEAASQQEQDPQTARVYASALELAEQLERVPVHVIPCVEGRVDGAPLGLAAAVFGSIIPAAWSFQLALRSRGLGSVWTTLHLFEERRAAELLGIPDSVTQVALIPVAYTLGDEFRPATRGPVEEITSWDTWGARL
ncbi:MAG: nitroreductase family protein [Acidimicrobiales bacterium]